MTDDGLSPERATRLADAVDSIERNVSELRTYQELSRDEYRADENREKREAVERKFEKLIAASVDAGETVLAAEGESIPDRRKDVITRLERIGVLDDALCQKMHEAIGFRDVLAHTYGPIVNDDIVYDVLQNGLDRYVEFAETIHGYLSD